MIAQLSGQIIETFEQVVISCGGVGYGVIMTAYDSAQLSLNEPATLFVYEHIKEDSHDLFGFINIETKKLFQQLISVKNVGPKSALAILDTGSSDQVRQAIADGNVKFLQTAKGIGKRAAEQIVVELRDKVGAPVGDAAENLINRSGINQNDEALQALTTLGYTEADAQIALQDIDPTLSVEDRIKQALKGGA